jgi:hypothetical protein
MSYILPSPVASSDHDFFFQLVEKEWLFLPLLETL